MKRIALWFKYAVSNPIHGLSFLVFLGLFIYGVVISLTEIGLASGFLAFIIPIGMKIHTIWQLGTYKGIIKMFDIYNVYNTY